MRTLILYASTHHGNTKKVVQVMAEELSAHLTDVTKEPVPDLSEYDMVGFASGIYYGKVHNALSQILEQCKPQAGQKAFGVCSCGAKSRGYTQMLEDLLTQKGFSCLGAFQCQGFDTFGPFKLVGGIAKGHPDQEELAAARTFAKRLVEGKA